MAVAAAAGGAAYLAALLAADRYVSLHGQWALGALTWIVLLGGMRLFAPERRAQALGVVVFATVGELTGSIVWGVYSYRLGNLPLFIPPAHGIVYDGRGLAHAGGAGRTHARSSRRRPSPRRPGGCSDSWCSRGATSPARSASRCSSPSSGDRVTAPCMRPCSCGRGPRAVRHGDRDVEVGDGAAGTRDPRREPAVGGRVRLRVVRRDGASRGAGAHAAGRASEPPRARRSGASTCGGQAARAVSCPGTVTHSPRARRTSNSRSMRVTTSVQRQPHSHSDITHW